MSSYNPAELQRRVDEMRAAEPNIRIRDIANKLDVREGQLVALGCGSTATRLQARFSNLLQAFGTLGEIMALTRNDHAVHEKIGTYRNISVEGMQGLVLDPEIDLRVFLAQWGHAFAVREETKAGLRESIQTFDHAGDAVHKVYLQEVSDRAAYAKLISDFKHDDQSAILTVKPRATLKEDRPDREIDVAGFRSAWRGMRDTHEFFGLLRKFGLGRTQALRLAENDLAGRLTNNAARRVFELAAERSQPIMVFVGNPGMIQIHTGPIKRLVTTGPWFNVLDPRFNLHLREDAIAESWLVKKPTEDGIVTSVEVFDKQGQNIALLFGQRKPGVPELEGWRALVSELENDRVAA